jgi:hypothetical protein
MEDDGQVSVVSDQTQDPLPIKVFAMNDCDWYAAATAEDALRGMATALCFPDGPQGIADMRNEYDVGDPVEVSAADMERLRFRFLDEDGETVPESSTTFRERLAEMVRDREDFPCFFASTEY